MTRVPKFLLPPSSAVSYLLYPQGFHIPTDTCADLTHGSLAPVSLFDRHYNAVSCVRYLRNRNDDLVTHRVLTGSRDTLIREWDTQSGTPHLARLLVGHSDWVTSIGVGLRDNATRLVVSGSQDQTVRLWTLRHDTFNPYAKTAQVVYSSATLNHHKDYVSSVALSCQCEDAKPRWLLTGDISGNVALVDLETCQHIAHDNVGNKHPVLAVSTVELTPPSEFHTAIHTLGFSSYDALGYAAVGQQLVLWDIRNGQRVWDNPKGHGDMARCFQVTLDGHQGISGGSDGFIRLWDFRTGNREPYREFTSYDSVSEREIWKLDATLVLVSYPVVFENKKIWALWAKDAEQFFVGTRSGTVLGFGCPEKQVAQEHIQPGDVVKTQNCDHSNASQLNAFCTWTASVGTIQETESGYLPDGCAQQQHMILDLDYNLQTSELWVATGGSSVFYWKLKAERRQDKDVASSKRWEDLGADKKDTVVPKPDYVLPGRLKLVDCLLLRDQRTALTRSLDNEITSWDVVTGSRKKIFEGSWETFREDVLVPFQSLLPWCTLDVALGVLRVTVEPTTVFRAERVTTPGSAVENYGCMILSRYFGNSSATLSNAENSAPRECSTTVIGFPESTAYNHAIAGAQAAFPSWVNSWVQDGFIPDGVRPPSVCVCLTPSPATRLLLFSQSFFTCKRWTLLSTIVTHILKCKSVASSTTGAKQEVSGDNTKITIDCVTLTCQGRPLDMTWDIGTVRDLIWKKHWQSAKADVFKPFEIM